MIPKRQNLFLFFEENDVQYIISNKLVLLYANRCIIDEDAGFEVCGVYQLHPISDPMDDERNPLYETYENQRACKEASDKGIISEALEKAYLMETNSFDTHFIIGTHFYTIGTELRRYDRMKKFYFSIFAELTYQEMKKIYITFLTGRRNAVITKESNLEAYRGEFVEHNIMSFPESHKKDIVSTSKPKFSVNDDFESSITLIQSGERLDQQIRLFFNPMLTPQQLNLLETKDESYLRSFGNYLYGNDPDIIQKELGKYPNSDSKLRFVWCSCSRVSFYIRTVYDFLPIYEELIKLFINR